MRRWLAFFATPFLLLPSCALASTLVVSESGTFAPNTPPTAFSAPGASFSYSFDVSSSPNATVVSLGNYFNTDFSNFTYTLNGVASVPPVGSITFFSSGYNGLYDICFVTACNGANSPGVGFELVGDQAYLGAENDPTILPGSYAPSEASFVSGSYFGDLTSSSPVVIAPAVITPIGATPELSGITLFGSGLLALFGLLRLRQRA